MQKAEITPGEEYALREVPGANTPFHHVRILQHVRGSKWKAEWIEAEPGTRGLRRIQKARRTMEGP